MEHAGMTNDDLDNLRDLAKRQSANHAEKKILAAAAEIERLRGEAERKSRIENERSQRAVEMETEIERLRQELADVTSKPFAYCTEPRSEILARQQAEIEQLRHEVTLREQICADATLYARRLQEADDEVERLRGLLLEAREFLPDEVISIEHRRDTDYADHLADRIDAALSPERMLEERDAEIERLREWQKMAQEEINRLRGLLYEVWDAAPYLGGDLNRRVREALGDD